MCLQSCRVASLSVAAAGSWSEAPGQCWTAWGLPSPLGLADWPPLLTSVSACVPVLADHGQVLRGHRPARLVAAPSSAPGPAQHSRASSTARSHCSCPTAALQPRCQQGPRAHIEGVPRAAADQRTGRPACLVCCCLCPAGWLPACLPFLADWDTLQCAPPSSLHASSGWCVVRTTCSCVCTTTTQWTRSRLLRHTQTTSGVTTWSHHLPYTNPAPVQVCRGSLSSLSSSSSG